MTQNLLDQDDCDDTSLRLAQLMSDLSENCWSAGWLSGTEFDLWDLAHSGSGGWGVGVVSPGDAARLLALAKESGGWVAWKDDVGAIAVPMDEWLKMVESNR